MTAGPATILALAAALLAAACWWLIRKPVPTVEVVAMFVFGLALAVVVLAGPLVRLP